MKKIKIFLANDNKNLANDKSEISNFIKKLNEIYEQFEISIQLVTDDGKKDKEIEVFVILFNSNVDVVKLNIIMQLQTLKFNQVKFETREGKLYLNDEEILVLQNIPSILSNKQLIPLRLESDELEKSFWGYKEIVKDDPDNEKAFNKFVEIKNKRNKLRQMKEDLERDIINLENLFVEMSSKNPLSERQMHAKTCFENGDIEEAKKVLAFDEIKSAGEQALIAADYSKLQITINELILRTEILKIDINNENRFLDIEQSFEKALEFEKQSKIKRVVPIKYCAYLNYQDKCLKSIDVLNDYIKYLEVENLKIEWNVYELLGIAYLGTAEYIKAETYMLLAIDKLNNECEQSFCVDELSYLYNNLAAIYSETGRYKLTEKYLLLSIEAMKKKTRTKETTYLLSMQHYSLGKLYHNLAEHKKAEQCCLLALKLLTRLSREDSEIYEEDLAKICNKLAVIYFDMQSYQEAENYYLISKEIQEQLVKENSNRYTLDLSITYNSLGLCYKAMQNFIEAGKYFLLGIELLENSEANKRYKKKLVTYYSNLAILYFETNKNQLAEKYFLLNIELLEELVIKHSENYCFELASVYNNIAKLYKRMEQIDNVIKYYTLSIEYMENLESTNKGFYTEILVSLYQDLAEIYRDNQEIDKSMNYINKSLELIKDKK